MKTVATQFVSAALLAVGCLVAAHAAGPGYHLLREIPVPGDGGWDYLTVDSATHRLYLSHGTTVVVIDTNTNQVVGEIADTPGVHGLFVAADLSRGFTTNGRENKVGIVDLANRHTLMKVEVGENPDAGCYNPATHEFYAFNGPAPPQPCWTPAPAAWSRPCRSGASPSSSTSMSPRERFSTCWRTPANW